MKKLVPIGLFFLLLYHTLAYVLLCLSVWWQAEHDLSEQLLVYRSTDNLVEFHISLKDKPEAKTTTITTSDGFRYHRHYYGVTSQEVRSDTLYIAGLEVKSQFAWPGDLFSFLIDHLTGRNKSNRKVNQLLTFFLKEYSPTSRIVFCFCPPNWRKVVHISDWSLTATIRYQPVLACTTGQWSKLY